MYIEKYFDNYYGLYEINPKKIKDYKKKGNKITAKVFKKKITLINLDVYLLLKTKCDCFDIFCTHLYGILKAGSYMQYSKDIEEFKKYKYKLNKAFKESLNGEKLRKPLFKKDITDSLLSKLKVLDKETYINITEMITSFDFDSYVNTNYRKGNSFESELNILIYLHLNLLIYKEEYEIAFEVMKILYPYIMRQETNKTKYLKRYIPDIIEQFNIIFDKLKRSEIQKEVFDWLTENVQIPYNNKLLTNLRARLRSGFNLEKYDEAKEEFSLYMLNKSKRYDMRKIRDKYSEYYIISLYDFKGFEKESEYWFKFHFSILKKLKYSDEEIILFLREYEYLDIAKEELKKYLGSDEEKNIEIREYKRKLGEKLHPLERISILESIMELDESFEESPEYLDSIKHLIFEDGYLLKTYIRDYIKLEPNGINELYDLKDELEDLYKDGPILNEFYYKNGEIDKIYEYFKYTLESKELYKYEDLLIKNYGDEFFKNIEDHLYKWFEYGHLEYEEVRKIFNFISKYHKGIEVIKTIRDCCEDLKDKTKKKIGKYKIKGH